MVLWVKQSHFQRLNNTLLSLSTELKQIHDFGVYRGSIPGPPDIVVWPEHTRHCSVGEIQDGNIIKRSCF